MKFRSITGLSAVGFALLAGCPQNATNTGGTSSSGDSLSTTEQDAISAALASVESLVTSVDTTQTAAGGDSAAARTATDNCPLATFSASNEGGLSLAVGLDFGDGCNVLGSDDYFCSGSASGEFSAANGALVLTFESLNCGSKSLVGDVAFTFTSSDALVTLSGQWNVNYSDSTQTVGTIGDGEATFDGDTKSTTVTTFSGSVNFGTQTSECEMTGLVTSLANNGNFVPSAGTLALSGPTVDDVVVTFDANSPSTGDVQVSINGKPSFTYNLFDGE
jgi:hypothetical protein